MAKSFLPFHAADDFSRAGTANLGITTSGIEWIEESTSPFRIDATNKSAYAEFTSGVKNSVPSLAYLKGRNDQSQEVLFKFKANRVGFEFGPAVLVESPAKFLTLSIQVLTYNTTKVKFTTRFKSSVNKTFTNISTNTKDITDVNLNTYYWCRVEYDSSTTNKTIRSRIWKESVPEPTSWDVSDNLKTAQNGKSVATSGSQGFWVRPSEDTNSSPVRVDFSCAYFYSVVSREYTANGTNGFINNDLSSFSPLPISDNFTRTLSKGWGFGNALWYGNVSEAPETYRNLLLGSVQNNKATISITQSYTDNGGAYAFWGNYTNQASEFTVEFSPNELTDDLLSRGTILRFGVLGKSGVYNNKTSSVGYALEVPLSSTSSIKLVKRDTISQQGWSDDVTSSAFSGWDESGATTSSSVNLVAKENYTAKVQKIPAGSGYILKAKIWKTNQGEPANFQLKTYVAAPVISSGNHFINLSSTGTWNNNNQIISFYTANTYTSVTPTIYIDRRLVPTITNVSLESITDKKVKLLVNYSDRAIPFSDGAQINITYWKNGDPNNKFSITKSTSPSSNDYAPATRKGSFSFDVSPLDPKTLYTAIVSINCGYYSSGYQASFRTKFAGIYYLEPQVTDIRTGSAKIILVVPETDFNQGFDNSSVVVKYKKSNEVDYALSETMIPVTTKGNDNYAGIGYEHFGCVLSNLNPDTTYQYRVYISDPEGVDAINEQDTSLNTLAYVDGEFTTFGRRPELFYQDSSSQIISTPIKVEQFATSARVSIHYRWDINNEIVFSLRWRIAGQSGAYWNTYGDRPYLKGTTNELDKQWVANIIGLSPGITYELEVVAYHPSGILNSSSVFLTNFTTKLVDPPFVKRPKHYIYKVYDGKSGNFLGTLQDATQPSFALYENGGVTDLTIKLPRQANSLVTDKLLTLGNRVDVWVIDHTSDGIGRNMISDGDMSLGGWTTASGWYIDPEGGPDQSAALRVDMSQTSSSENYALSEEVPILLGSKSSITKYRVIISVSKLLENYKTELMSTAANYEGIADNIRLKLNSLIPSTTDLDLIRELNPQEDALLDKDNGLLSKASTDFSLVGSVEFVLTADSYAKAKAISEAAEAINCVAFINEETLSESIPHVLQLAANATNGQIRAQIEYGTIFDDELGNTVTIVSEESVETAGSGWQILKMVVVPPYGATTMRIRIAGDSSAVGWVDKVQLLPQELLLYRGRIETIRSEIGPDGESITIEVLGLASQLTDVYVRFKQWVNRQPSRDQPKLVDNNFVDDKPPPFVRSGQSKLISVRESSLSVNRWSILFESITPSQTTVRVYYDGDNESGGGTYYSANGGGSKPNSTCWLYYTANMEENFNGIERGVNTGFSVNTQARVTATAGLYLRSNATQASTAILLMPYNSTVTIIDPQQASKELSKTSGGWTWYKVSYNGQVGWCAGEYLTPVRTATSSGFAAGSIVKVNATDGLRLRQAAGTNQAVVSGHSPMPYGTVLKIKSGPVAASGYSWYNVVKVQSNSNGGWNEIDGAGWCAGEYLVPVDGGVQSNLVRAAKGTQNTANQYFEFVLKDINPGIPYKFIARLSDPDGVISAEQQITEAEDGAPSVFTRVRTLQDNVTNVGNNETAIYKAPTDPAQMLREIIDEAREISSFDIYYTTDSVKNTEYDVQYTFRDTQLRNCVDKIREFCPSQWHWFVDASGCIYLRGPQHTMTHFISVGREAISSSSEMTITNLKNIIVLKGRQDTDRSESDSEGSIKVEVKNDLSIEKYGPRYLFIRDSNIKDLSTAQLVALGRLDENQREERQSSVVVLDKKDILDGNSPLHGYNIEAFQPGDYIVLDQAVSNTIGLQWDTAVFNQAYWDTGLDLTKERAVQIKKIQYDGDRVTIELSQRQPSAVGDFARLVRWQQMQEQSTSD